MKIIGLTGSIAMGKSATAQMFRKCGVPVSDSDAIVHALYRKEAVEALAPHFPDAVSGDLVDRQILAKDVLRDPERMRLLESIVHPLVERKRREFLDHHGAAGTRIVVVDIPLLFETGGAALVDIIVVVSAAESIQRARAFTRQGMTEEKFNAIVTRQCSDVEKRRRAHFVIRSDYGFDAAMNQVKSLLRAIA